MTEERKSGRQIKKGTYLQCTAHDAPDMGGGQDTKIRYCVETENMNKINRGSNSEITACKKTLVKIADMKRRNKTKTKSKTNEGKQQSTYRGTNKKRYKDFKKA